MAAAIAAGEAAAACLSELYQHPEDQQLLAEVQGSFERILFFQLRPSQTLWPLPMAPTCGHRWLQTAT